MKKAASLLCAVLILACLCVPAFAAQKEYIVDEALLLEVQEAATIQTRLQALSDQLDMDIVIATTTHIDGKSLEAYADDYYDYNNYGVGREGDRSGVILVVYDNGYGTERWISTSGYCQKAFTDYGIEKAGETLKPIMEDGEWEQAFLKFADISESYITQAKNGKAFDRPVDVVKGLLIAGIAALIIALVVIAMVKSAYKPVRMQTSASEYLISDSVHLTQSYDRFRNTAVTRRRIETESSSGRGSSTHTSSSGRSHGGGGF